MTAVTASSPPTASKTHHDNITHLTARTPGESVMSAVRPLLEYACIVCGILVRLKSKAAKLNPLRNRHLG